MIAIFFVVVELSIIYNRKNSKLLKKLYHVVDKIANDCI